MVRIDKIVPRDWASERERKKDRKKGRERERERERMGRRNVI